MIQLVELRLPLGWSWVNKLGSSRIWVSNCNILLTAVFATFFLSPNGKPKDKFTTVNQLLNLQKKKKNNGKQ